MKGIFFLTILFLPTFCFAQAVTADPSLEPLRVTNMQNTEVQFSQLPLNGTVKLKLPIRNRNTTVALPSGSCKIKIGLGSKLSIAPSFTLNNAALSNYFFWTAVSSGGQVQITGDLIDNLPANFSDTAVFDLRGFILGTSTITANFLVTNHNTGNVLSDENGTNNLASQGYVIVPSLLPVLFTGFNAASNNCSLKAEVTVASEVNVKGYALELSTDLANFEVVDYTAAVNADKYSFNLSTLPEKYKANVIAARVKAINNDGSVQFSGTKILSTLCKTEKDVVLYPNPAPTSTRQVTIETNRGYFNGSYQLQVFDMAGKLIATSQHNLRGIGKFAYDISGFASGQYLIKLTQQNNTNSSVLKFVKY
jgi:hypothetical protein